MADFARDLPKWQASKYRAKPQKKSPFLRQNLLTKKSKKFDCNSSFALYNVDIRVRERKKRRVNDELS